MSKKNTIKNILISIAVAIIVAIVLLSAMFFGQHKYSTILSNIKLSDFPKLQKQCADLGSVSMLDLGFGYEFSNGGCFYSMCCSKISKRDCTLDFLCCLNAFDKNTCKLNSVKIYPPHQQDNQGENNELY
jgi:hypothetical protein